VVVDPRLCIGCGECVDRCQFRALTMPDEVAIVEEARCMGCGQCTLACTSDALALERRAPGEMQVLPENLFDWMAMRGEVRGLPFPGAA
jgi:MinD superfamily P-loop ATPase